MKERRIKKATIGRSGDHYNNKGFNLEILDDSGYEHRLYGSPEEMYDLGRKILQASPQIFTQQTKVLLSGKAVIESKLHTIGHNLSAEHHDGSQ